MADSVDPRVEYAKLLLEVVKVLAIGLGFYFTYVELRNSDRDREFLRHQTTSAMISGLGNSELIAARLRLFQHTELEPTNSNFVKFSYEISPIRQHLITWSACIEAMTCARDNTVELLCRNILNFEGGVEIANNHFNKPYNFDRRNSAYFGRFSKCIDEYNTFAILTRLRIDRELGR